MKNPISYSSRSNVLGFCFQFLMIFLLQLVIADILIQDYLKYSDKESIEIKDTCENETDETGDFEEELEKETEKEYNEHKVYSVFQLYSENIEHQYFESHFQKRHRDKIPVPPPEYS